VRGPSAPAVATTFGCGRTASIACIASIRSASGIAKLKITRSIGRSLARATAARPFRATTTS
jgi:hypothetical protein